MRRASGSQGFYYRAIVQALEPGDQEPRTPGPRIDTTRPFQGSHLAAAESLLGEDPRQGLRGGGAGARPDARAHPVVLLMAAFSILSHRSG